MTTGHLAMLGLIKGKDSTGWSWFVAQRTTKKSEIKRFSRKKKGLVDLGEGAAMPSSGAGGTAAGSVNEEATEIPDEVALGHLPLQHQ